MNKIYKSGEDYLETILILRDKGYNVRSIDISNAMKISRASVCRAVVLLKENGLIEVTNNKYILLTQEGEKIAKQIYEKHTILTKWFVSLGIDEQVASCDACKLEHTISSETFQKIKDYIYNNQGAYTEC